MKHKLNQDCWEKYQQLQYAYDTALMEETEEELRPLDEDERGE